MEFNRWNTYGYVTAITPKRHYGQSKAPYDGLNFAYHVGDEKADVTANRLQLLKQLQLSPNRIVFAYQSHSDIIKKVTLKDGGTGFESYESGIAADALYTYDTRLALGIFHADCVPVFLFDKVKKWVAIIHAGTPGSLNRITEKSVRHLIEREGSNPKDIRAYIGPALTFAFHPIAEAERDAILAQNPDFFYALKRSDGINFLDVPLLNVGQLRHMGVPSANITASGIDTYSNPNEYFSYARDKKTGRHMSLIIRER